MAERSGDFSALGVNIYDPSTGSTATTRTQFMGCNGTTPNVICPTEFSPVATTINNLLPPASMYANQNPGNNFLAGLPFGLSNFTATGRADYIVSDKHAMSVIIAAGRQASVGPAAQTTSVEKRTAALQLRPGICPEDKDRHLRRHVRHQPAHGEPVQVRLCPVLQPLVQSRQHAGLRRLKPGNHGCAAGQASTSFPEVTFAGTDAPTQWGGDTGGKNLNAYYAIDNYQWDFGKHLLTFGAQIAWLQYQYTLDTGGSSQLILATNTSETAGYTSGTTINPGTGLSYASFLVGQIDAGNLTQNAVQETGARFRPISPYVQDDWKISAS